MELSNIKEEILSHVTEDNRVVINEQDVRKALYSVKCSKAMGPDGLGGKVLKSCCQQLSEVFHMLFQWSMDIHSVPLLWKSAIISPVPKISKPKDLNDYRPIALTPIIMKCFERVVKGILMEETKAFTDPLQFAYQKNRGVDDAVAVLSHTILSHLEKPKTYVRVLFIDFSSAFNTVVPHILINKLYHDMNINPNLLLWIGDFMSNRSQKVKCKDILSQTRILNTGTPQGCVLSPTLFTLFTSEVEDQTNSCWKVVKYADDTCIIGLITDRNENMYRTKVDDFVMWCKQMSLILNIKKTKEMIVDFRKKDNAILPLAIDQDDIEMVSNYKYLGTHIDKDFSWNTNTQTIVSKVNQRLYLLRKLKTFNIRRETLLFFYDSIIKPIISFSCLVWFFGLTSQNKMKLMRVMKTASKAIGLPVKQLEEIAESAVIDKFNSIIGDETHPLRRHIFFNKSGRVRLPKVKTNRFRGSFLIRAMTLYNDRFRR